MMTTGGDGPAPFRFCVATGGAGTAAGWRNLVCKVESLGYDLLAVTDHIDQPMAPFTALATAAAHTTTLRLGSYVLNHALRGPVVLAKEFASLDVLSGGRAELGLGVGWRESDYTQAGASFESRPQRFERFTEYLDIVTRLLAGSVVTQRGRHFSVSEARCVPSPVQQPIPLLMGGSRRRMIELTARHADTVSIAPTTRADGRRAAFRDVEIDERIRRVHAAAAGRSVPPEIDLAVHECQVLPRPHAVIARLSAHHGIRSDRIDSIPSFLIGSAEHVTEVLLARRERWGASRVTIPESAVDMMAPVVARLSGT
jgi:probable F420-dependent oxidoreductase